MLVVATPRVKGLPVSGMIFTYPSRIRKWDKGLNIIQKLCH